MPFLHVEIMTMLQSILFLMAVFLSDVQLKLHLNGQGFNIMSGMDVNGIKLPIKDKDSSIVYYFIYMKF